MKFICKKHLFWPFLLFIGLTVDAEVSVSPLFSDNMVLQQQSDAPIWGEATPNSLVQLTTSWDKSICQIRSDEKGHWKTLLKTPSWGGPYTIRIRCGNQLNLKNVLIGEVWICAGQSNMEMPLAGWGKVANYQQEITNADYPQIRLLQVNRNTSVSPLNAFQATGGGWQLCSPKTIAGFSSVSYFFGRDLAEKTGIPIGLINTAWGGTVIEAWTSEHALMTTPYFTDQLKHQTEQADKEASIEKTYRTDLENWKREVNKADFGCRDALFHWADPTLQDTGWGTMKIPDLWENQGLAGFDGIVWFRKTVTIPESWQHKALVLSLDMIDDNDVTFFNGVQIGETKGWNVARMYTIPAKLVEKGQATIAVRVTDQENGGGIFGSPENIKLSLNSHESIGLSGQWHYKQSVAFHELPVEPADIHQPNRPSVLFNAMLHPLIPYKIRGVIWYQGEANHDRAYQYRELFPLLIRDWRNQWGYTFPFYFVQVANYLKHLDQPADDDRAELREAQTYALKLDQTGMAVAIDIGDAGDIHPKNKQEVGRRLALIAQSSIYGGHEVFSGPLYRSYYLKGDSAFIQFSHAEGGLKTSDGASLKGFAIAGADHVFHWAEATVSADEVVVHAKDVPFPIAVRYAWAANPICNLCNEAGLPASPFRTDDWQGITYGKH
ncbi:MAG: sialate O-acetylesterase [Bacteroidota bacterium]|nr:sialate O-acetylesterase [Bacteroidota bacterium]